MSNDNSTGDVIDQTTIDPVIDQQANESGASSASAQPDVTTEGQENVNWKNKFYETNRKLENLTKSIPQMIQEAAVTAAQQTQVKTSKEPEYSVQDFIRAKAQDPTNAPYYDAQIEALREKKLQETVTTQLTQFEQKRQQETLKQQADNWALTNFPQLRDASNAFSQQVWAAFNSRPAEKREPHDFALAAELVAARMGIKPATLVNTQQDKVLQKERELKKLTRERAIEGDGRSAVNVGQITQRQSDLRQALDKGKVGDYILKHWIKPKEAEE